jgi:predicted SprT family Zn-dependent metalloprotease
VYYPKTRHIRLHPALDQAFVPRFFVEFIVYHELLHHVIPAVEVNGRYYVHTKMFRQRERLFRRYPEAMAWRQRHLRQLLASNKGRSAQR